jgi:hypothetical protein
MVVGRYVKYCRSNTQKHSVKCPCMLTIINLVILQSSAFVMIFNCIAVEFHVANTEEGSAEGHTCL